MAANAAQQESLRDGVVTEKQTESARIYLFKK